MTTCTEGNGKEKVTKSKEIEALSFFEHGHWDKGKGRGFGQERNRNDHGNTQQVD